MRSKVSLRIVKNNFDSKCYDSAGGFISNCHIEMRAGESLHGYNRDGAKIVSLDNYAIVPKDKYLNLIANKDKTKNLWQRIFGSA